MGARSRTLASVVVAFIAAACSGGQGTNGAGTSITIGGQTIVSNGQVDIGGQTAEDIDVRNFSYDPTVLSGSGGQRITITIHNRGTGVHNFSLPQEQVDQDVGVGGSEQVTVTLPANGAIVFYCKYHRSRGMLGVLRAG